jgi:glucokinase
MGEEMVIGVDLGGTNMRTALIDHTGNIIRRQTAATAISSGVRQTTLRLIAECQAQMDAAGKVGARSWGSALASRERLTTSAAG